MINKRPGENPVNGLNRRKITLKDGVQPQAFDCPLHHTCGRVIHQISRNAKGLGQQFIDAAQQCSAAAQRHTPVNNIRDQLRWSLFEDAPAGFDNMLERFLQVPRPFHRLSG